MSAVKAGLILSIAESDVASRRNAKIVANRELSRRGVLRDAAEEKRVRCDRRDGIVQFGKV